MVCSDETWGNSRSRYGLFVWTGSLYYISIIPGLLTSLLYQGLARPVKKIKFEHMLPRRYLVATATENEGNRRRPTSFFVPFRTWETHCWCSTVWANGCYIDLARVDMTNMDQSWSQNTEENRIDLMRIISEIFQKYCLWYMAALEGLRRFDLRAYLSQDARY